MNLIKTIYDGTLRKHLPRKIASYNGVAVRRPRLFDHEDWIPNMKHGLVREVRNEVGVGDDVVDIGTGFGVAATWAARESRTGRIVTYDASIDQVETAIETMKLNSVEDHVSVRHSLVGEKVKVNMQLGSPEIISPDDVPACDVMILDCEGAELSVLPAVADNPETFIVETHGHLGASSDDVVSVLSRTCSEVEVRGEAGIDSAGRDNKVVVGRKS